MVLLHKGEKEEVRDIVTKNKTTTLETGWYVVDLKYDCHSMNAGIGRFA